MYRLILLAALLLLLNACGNSNGTTDNDGQPLDGAAEVTAELPAGNAAQATLRGTLNIEGLTVEALPGSGQNGQANPPRILGKIINPGDDILSEGFILPGMPFELNANRNLRGKLALEFVVSEDVNGDGVTPDTVRQSIPVSLVLGKVSSLNATLRRGVPVPPDAPTTGQGQVEDVFFPATGEILTVTLNQQDASGASTAFYGARPDGTVLFDTNGDLRIEPGTDRLFVDEDTNGWPDTEETAYASLTEFRVDGVVSAVDVLKRQITVLDATGAQRTVVVDPYASITPITADGVVLGPLVLDQTLVGRSVQASGYDDGASRYANLIVVLPLGK